MQVVMRQSGTGPQNEYCIQRRSLGVHLHILNSDCGIRVVIPHESWSEERHRDRYLLWILVVYSSHGNGVNLILTTAWCISGAVWIHTSKLPDHLIIYCFQNSDALAIEVECWGPRLASEKCLSIPKLEKRDSIPWLGCLSRVLCKGCAMIKSPEAKQFVLIQNARQVIAIFRRG